MPVKGYTAAMFGFASFPLKACVLSWMLADAATEPPTPWRHTYPDLAEQIADAAEANPLKQGPIYTAALLETIAFQEAHLHPSPPCTPQCGPFQSDPPYTAKHALELVHESLKRCGDLTRYASGKCGHGRAISNHRLWLTRRLISGLSL